MSTAAAPGTGAFDIERKPLAEALHATGLLADPKSRFSWRRDVTLRLCDGELHMSAESEEAAVIVKVPAAGGKGGEMAIPQSILRKSVDAFSCERICLRRVSAGSLELTGGARSIMLDAHAPSAARSTAPGRELCSFRAPGAELTEALGLVSRCASGDARRPTLNTVAFDVEDGHPVVLATDTYRLAVFDIEVEAGAIEQPQLMHIAATKALVKALKRSRPEDVMVEIGGEGTTVSYDGIVWCLRRAPGTYPGWRDLISVDGARLTLRREEMTETLEAVRVLAGSGREPLRLVLGPTTSLLFTSGEVGHLREELPGAFWEGEPMDIGFSPGRLADAITLIDEDKLIARLTTPVRPALFERPGRRYLLMPTKLPETETRRDGAVASSG